MKNNYNPYTVPENFFEDSCQMAVNNFKRSRRIVCCSVAGFVAAIAVFSTVFVSRTNVGHIQEEAVANNLAQLYEYDIFLQVNNY